MKRNFYLWVICFLLCIQWVPPVTVEAQGERLVLAFYYAWFDMTTWAKPLSDQPSQPYLSTDPAAIERHVLWAQQAGIDGLVQSWYGPQVENNQTEPNFAALLDVAAQHGFTAAADLEVGSPFINSEAELVAALQYLMAVHANHPAYLRVGGKPVIFFWRQNRYSVQSWYNIRDQVDPGRTSIWIMEGIDLSYLGPFDGNHLYSVAWDPAPEGVLTRWGQRVRDWSATNGAFKYWVSTVMPGYDDRVTGRADAFVRERGGGDYYRRCWQGAMQSQADWVIITSFNEWMEGSQIEPSVGYGDFYLTLTNEQGALYRSSTVPPTAVPPTAIPPTAVPPTAILPTNTPLPPPTFTPTVPPTLAPTATPVPTATLIPTETVPPTPSPTRTAIHVPTSLPAAPFVPPPSPTWTVEAVLSPASAAALPEQVIEEIWDYSGLLAGGLALGLILLVTLRSRRR